ncbi:MAG: 50S ribosomal protein L29 [Thermodesulfobacteriota bacterium]
MKIKEIREMSPEALAKREGELAEELFKLRFQHAIRQLENTARIRQVKKAIARIKTVQTERTRKLST